MEALGVQNDGSQSTLQLWTGGAVVSAPTLVSGGQRFESSPVHFFSLLSQNRISKNELPRRVVWWQRLEKESPMKSLFLGKTFPITPVTTQTTALANDQLLPPPLPSLPPLPPPPPSPRVQDISSRREIHPPGPLHPDHHRGHRQAGILPGYDTITTTTTAATAVIAALAGEYCMELVPEGSGYGGRSGHHIPHTISTPIYLTITYTATAAPTAAPTTIAATVPHEGDPANAKQRNQDTFRRHQVLRVRQLGEGRGHCRRRSEMIGGVKLVTVRWVRLVRWVWKVTRGSVRVSRIQCAPSTTPPPPPNRHHRNRCPCSECCVRRELSTPDEVSFPAKWASRWGGGRSVVPLQQLKAANNRTPALGARGRR